ncbi:MAG: FliA/WhiG family RNA polymerase sigma factor [Patescibacteria group bacterium]
MDGNGNGKERMYLNLNERNEMMLKHADMVKFIALRLISRLPDHISVGDLISAGVLGLMDALNKYDSSEGVPFNFYAKIRIRGAMLDEIRAMDWVPRSLRRKSGMLERACASLEQRFGRDPTEEEIAEELQISEEDFFKLMDEIKGISFLPENISEVIRGNREIYMLAVGEEEHFNAVFRKEIAYHLTEAIGRLPEKEQTVLTLYYYEELTMKEIGVVLGYSESMISLIHTKAVLRARKYLRQQMKPEDLPDACNKDYLGKYVASVGEAKKIASSFQNGKPVKTSPQISPLLIILPPTSPQNGNTTPRSAQPMTFGRRLKELRLEKGWSQLELAKRAECTRFCVYRAELEKRVPPPNTVRRLAKVFRLTREAKSDFYELAGVSYY